MDPDVSFDEAKCRFAFFEVLFMCVPHKRSSYIVTLKIFGSRYTFQFCAM